MKIETKYAVGDDVFYFSTEHMKLVHATITQLHISINEAYEVEKKYTLNIAPINSSLENDLTVWLSSPLSKKEALVDNVVTCEKYLFGSKEEFDNEIYPKHEVYTEPSKLAFSPLVVTNGTSCAKEIIDVKNGNT